MDARQKILLAAGAVIGEVGFDDASTRVIFERAGVNKALIHNTLLMKTAALL